MDGLAVTLSTLDYAAVAVFGAAGALAAARAKRDFVTFCFFAAVTGVGGGTLRDLLIGAPVFWINEPTYLVVCIFAALAVWIFGGGTRRGRLLLWFDGLGMAAYASVGAMKAVSYHAPPLTAVLMGALTAAFGGVLRDVLAEEPSVLLRRDLYITPALVGATTFVLLDMMNVPPFFAGVAGFVVGFLIRGGAILYGWQLPAFRGRAPD